MKMIFALFSLMLFTTVAFAQVVAPADPTFLDGLLKFLQSPSGVIATVLALAEAGLRLYPSQKAMSLLVVVRYITKSGIVIFTFLDGILVALITSGQNKVAAPQAKHLKKK